MVWKEKRMSLEGIDLRRCVLYVQERSGGYGQDAMYISGNAVTPLAAI